MAYQNQREQPRTQIYSQQLQPHQAPFMRPSPGSISSSHNDLNKGQSSQGQSKSQQRRVDGYYHSGFWRDYGVQPLENVDHVAQPSSQGVGRAEVGGQAYIEEQLPNGGPTQNGRLPRDGAAISNRGHQPLQNARQVSLGQGVSPQNAQRIGAGKTSDGPPPSFHRPGIPGQSPVRTAGAMRSNGQQIGLFQNQRNLQAPPGVKIGPPSPGGPPLDFGNFGRSSPTKQPSQDQRNLNTPLNTEFGPSSGRASPLDFGNFGQPPSGPLPPDPPVLNPRAISPALRGAPLDFGNLGQPGQSQRTIVPMHSPDSGRPGFQLHEPPQNQSRGLSPARFDETTSYTKGPLRIVNASPIGRQDTPPNQSRGPSPARFDGPVNDINARTINGPGNSPQRKPPPSRSNTMPIQNNGTGPPPSRSRPAPIGQQPSRQQQHRPPLVDPQSPTRLAWDNPFPVFPTKPVRSHTTPSDGDMSRLNMDRHPSMDSSRPPTSASKASGRSTFSRQSERSNHSTEATSYANTIEDPVRELAMGVRSFSIGNGPYDEVPGPLARSMTMPVQQSTSHYQRRSSQASHSSGRTNYDSSASLHTNSIPNPPPISSSQRRPSEDSQNTTKSNYGPISSVHGENRSVSSSSFRNALPSFEFEDRETRSGSSASFRNNAQAIITENHTELRSGSSTGYGNDFQPAEFGPPARAQTFDVRPSGPAATTQARRDSLEEYMPNFDNPPSKDFEREYMPNFDGASSTAPLEDPLGLPLDGAPGIARPPTSLSQVHASKSQPNLRNQFDGSAFGAPQNAPPMPQLFNNSANKPQRVNSPDSLMGVANGRAFDMVARGGYGGGLARGQPDSYQGGSRQSDGWENNWNDPRNNQLRSAPPGGPPNGGFRNHPPHRMSDNPDALPGHPVPVRPGLMQNQGGRSTPQMQRRPPSAQRDSASSGPPPRPVTPPVTHQELDLLREKLKAAPSDYKSHLRLAKRLVEASNVLIDTDGDLDLKTRNKNRERFVLEAHKVIKKLVQHSYPDAMFYLAECYGAGSLGLQVDHKEAFSLYQSAAKLGHPGAAYRTAVCCEIGGEGSRKDPQKAVQWYRRAAALGDVGAMYKLGVILLRGLLGQQASPGEGVIWLSRAAERADTDNPHAVHELAVLHEFPPRASKLVQDLKYALQLYQQAARLGYRLSQTRLGKAFEHGQLGCPIDDRASIHWYSKAAGQEEPEAELALSGWYLTGARGVLESNDQESYLWARKAALREYPKAEYAMGYFSEVGVGCQINLEDAKRWYGRSASHNYPKAKEALANLHNPKGRRPRKQERYSRSGRNEECTVM